MRQQFKIQYQSEQMSPQSQDAAHQSPSHQNNWNSGHWTLPQNLKSIVYFQFNKSDLHSKLKMKQNKFFKQMSIFMETRSPIQCRSQCQKLLRKHKTFYNVIQSFKMEYGVHKFEEEYQILSQNPLVRFKGTIQMNCQRHGGVKEVQIQTDKSYLLRKSKKCPQKGVKMEQIQQGSNANIYPFLKVGWWV